MAHPLQRIEADKEKVRRTVDSNSHRFGQDVSICANEGRDFAQRIELEVLDVLNRNFGLHKFDVQLIFLCNSQQDCCPGIPLKRQKVSFERLVHQKEGAVKQRMTYFEAVELAERHDESDISRETSGEAV